MKQNWRSSWLLIKQLHTGKLLIEGHSSILLDVHKTSTHSASSRPRASSPTSDVHDTTSRPVMVSMTVFSIALTVYKRFDSQRHSVEADLARRWKWCFKFLRTRTLLVRSLLLPFHGFTGSLWMWRTLQNVLWPQTDSKWALCLFYQICTTDP